MLKFISIQSKSISNHNREPDFYRKLFQSHDNEQETNTFKFFQVPIGNAKVVKSFVFNKDAFTV